MSTIVRLYAHPVAGAEQRFKAESIGAWLLQHYGDAQQVGVQVFAGEPSAETEITGNVAALLASDAPEYVVLQSPGDGFTAFQIFQIVVAVISVGAALMASSPTMPVNVNRAQQSPNNALGARENQVRIGQRVEDIFGTVKATPSLMMPTYSKYTQHRKYEYGYYCVGRGYLDTAEISDGESLIANITGSSAAVYWPFSSPNGGVPVLQVGAPIIDPVLTVARSIEVDGITLKPLNQLQLTPGETYSFEPSGTGDVIRQDRKAPNMNSIMEPGDEITVAMPDKAVGSLASASADATGFHVLGGGDVGWVDPFASFRVGDVVAVVSAEDATNNGSYTVVAVDAIGNMQVSPVPADKVALETSFTVLRNYSGTYTVNGVADGFIELNTSTFLAPLTIAPATITVVTDTPVTEYTDWVTLVAPERTEVWVNIVAPNGLYKDDGGQSTETVEFELSIERLDPVTLAPTGVVEIITSTLSGSVQEERADTLESTTAWTGPARVRMRRTSQHDFDFNGRVSDEIKWADLYSVTPVAQAHFGNKTTIHTVTQATSRSTAVKTRQLNCIASRLLPIYSDGAFSGAFDAEGRHVSGSIGATSRLVDIIAAVAADPLIGARDLSTDVDLVQIASVQSQLDAWHAEAGQFNYTFDTDNMAFEETVMAIANAGFCTAFRQNGKIRLALDRAQASSTALFTHRNKKPGAETITRKFAADGDYDGVEFLYVDPDTQQTETILLPLDGSAIKPLKFEIPGIRSFAQAWFRANREYYKLKGQRLSIETSTTMDARSLLPNARIDIVDNTRFKSFDGEVVGQAGLKLNLSQPVQFEPGEPHSIVLMQRDGAVQSIPVTPGESSRQVVLRHAPAEAIVTQPGEEGVRTIYSFASDSARAAQAWLVQEIDLADGMYPVVRGINYSAAYYQADSLPVPDKATIIN